MATVGVIQQVRTPVQIKWKTVAGMTLIHVGALLAPWTFRWSAVGVFLILQFVTGVLGITVCYHRLLAHRSFRVPKWLEYGLTYCGVLALQNGPVKWVATHRVHHAFADRPQDPHSPNRGFWWAHMLWLFPFDELLDCPEQFQKYVPELVRDPVHRFLERTADLQTVIVGVLLVLCGGLPWLVWGLFLRIAFVYHITWLVNSAGHLWGYQSYRTNEGSRNNWWVALLSYGEGWHNNHHAYAYSAAHGLRWWELDVTYLVIRTLALFHMAWKVQVPHGGPAQLPSVTPRFESGPASRIPELVL